MAEWLDWLSTWLAPYSDAIGALAAAVSAFFGVVTAIVAIIAIRATANDSKDQTRPVVIALFRQSKHSDTAFELVVRNYGASAARDLRVSFEPEVDSESAERGTQMLAARYREPIAWLPPGSELTNTWWSGVNSGGPELVNKLKTPAEVTVSVSYKGNRLRRFRDEFKLADTDISLTTRNESSTSMPGRMKSITDSLAAISAHLKEIKSKI